MNKVTLKKQGYGSHAVMMDGKEVGKVIKRGRYYRLIDHLDNDNATDMAYSNFFQLTAAVVEHYVPRERKTMVDVPVSDPLPIDQNFPLVKVEAGVYRTQDGRYVVYRDRQDWYFGANDADGWSEWSGSLKDATESLRNRLWRVEQDVIILASWDLKPGDLVACSTQYGKDDFHWTFGRFAGSKVSSSGGFTYVKLEGQPDQMLSHVKAVREDAEFIRAKVTGQAAKKAEEERQAKRDAEAKELLGPDADAALLDDIEAILAMESGRDRLRSLLDQGDASEVESGHLMVTKAYAAAAAADGIHYPPDWVDGEQPATVEQDADAVQRWATEYPDADLFPIIIAENMDWELDRVQAALDVLVERGSAVIEHPGLSAGDFYRIDSLPSIADEDTDDEMLTITACRDGEPFDGAEVTNVESGALVGIFVNVQTYEQMQRLVRAMREQQDAASLIPLQS